MVPFETRPSYVGLSTCGSYLNVSGTINPAPRIALFSALAVSMVELTMKPACPNCTSVVNILVQVPIAQVTVGLLMMPSFTASMTRYSLIPPTGGAFYIRCHSYSVGDGRSRPRQDSGHHHGDTFVCAIGGEQQDAGQRVRQT